MAVLDDADLGLAQHCCRRSDDSGISRDQLLALHGRGLWSLLRRTDHWQIGEVVAGVLGQCSATAIFRQLSSGLESISGMD